ncbi:hypothetical protein [Paenibacillus sp. R14(2021)]|uniref:hypothetical protein n=1 Tax=Paenibacillus sp. R14(2021) TaxID=2859228 RepID=UPI001C614892|nr:hypothetical protein [Paenibacillus sp. R14(2021)]
MPNRICSTGLKALVLLTALLLGGCAAGSVLDNVEIHPPTKGLLHALQSDGMANVSDRGYSVTVEPEVKPPSGASEAALILQVRDSGGRPVEVFAEDMTKLLHLIVVSQDLSSFDHVHPVYEGHGKFRVKLTFPHGGTFLLLTEFMPDGKGLTVCKTRIAVNGDEPAAVPLTAGPPWKTTVDGVEITLSAEPMPGEIQAGGMAMLNFKLKSTETGERTVLEPYLGTVGHCVILDASAKQYLHVHAAAEMSAGASVMFHTQFPKPGTYKLWAQFQVKGKVIVAPFVIVI